MIAVVNVKPLENYILELEFNNSEIKYFDMKSYLEHGIFRDLNDKTIFNDVKIFYDTVNWSNGADLCPETLYEKSSTSI